MPTTTCINGRVARLQRLVGPERIQAVLLAINSADDERNHRNSGVGPRDQAREKRPRAADPRQRPPPVTAPPPERILEAGSSELLQSAPRRAK